MNNKPVAWMDEETGCFVYSQYDYEDLDEHGKDGLIPLYTHPSEHDLGIAEAIGFEKGHKAASTKTLTDEEIIDIAKEHIHQRLEGERFGYVDFAKAILRKAQEK